MNAEGGLLAQGSPTGSAPTRSAARAGASREAATGRGSALDVHGSGDESPLGAPGDRSLQLTPASRGDGKAAATYPWRAGPAPTAEKPERKVLSVGELTRQIKGTLERNFTRICVRGEISGFRGPNVRGHLYFSLKDADACLDVRIWASTAQRLKFKLRDGLEVVAEGSLDLYEPQGRYALIVQRLEPAGEGALALAFQQLKEQLQAEGLFGDKRKRAPRPIPFLPRRIGVVTSKTGAALQDFLRVLSSRHPRMSVLLCDARVQGEGAAAEVVSAIQRLSRTDVDVIVVTRGGGSIEDLWTFNEEAVARAIHASPVPVVSAIGHEVDFTIADFVADLRCPTPSAAAERLAPVLKDLELTLATHEGRLRKAVERVILADRQVLHRLSSRLSDPRRVLAAKRVGLSEQADALERAQRLKLKQARERLKALQDRLSRKRPQAQLSDNREKLKKLEARLLAAMRERVKAQRASLSRAGMRVLRASPAKQLGQQKRRLVALHGSLEQLSQRRITSARHRFVEQVTKLHALSPLQVMARGYAVAFRGRDGHLVRSAADVEIGEALSVRLLGAGCSTLAECDQVEATVTGVKRGLAGALPGPDGEA